MLLWFSLLLLTEFTAQILHQMLVGYHPVLEKRRAGRGWLLVFPFLLELWAWSWYLYFFTSGWKKTAKMRKVSHLIIRQLVLIIVCPIQTSSIFELVKCDDANSEQTLSSSLQLSHMSEDALDPDTQPRTFKFSLNRKWFYALNLGVISLEKVNSAWMIHHFQSRTLYIKLTWSVQIMLYKERYPKLMTSFFLA